MDSSRLTLWTPEGSMPHLLMSHAHISETGLPSQESHLPKSFQRCLRRKGCAGRGCQGRQLRRRDVTGDSLTGDMYLQSSRAWIPHLPTRKVQPVPPGSNRGFGWMAEVHRLKVEFPTGKVAGLGKDPILPPVGYQQLFSVSNLALY